MLQLSSELTKDTGHKLQWIKEAALALNPDDPHLGKYMRQCLEQAYQNCHCLMGVTTIPSELANLRLVIHVMNSLMSSCKWQPLMICHTYRSRVTRSGFFTRSAREISRIKYSCNHLKYIIFLLRAQDNTGRRSALSTQLDSHRRGDWRAEGCKLNHAHISPPIANCCGPIIMMMHPATLRQLFFYYTQIAWSVVSTQSSSCVVLCKNPVQVLFSHLSINLLCTIYFCSIVLINDNEASLAHACGLVWEIFPYKTMTMLVFVFWHVWAFYTTATLLLGRWSFYWFFVEEIQHHMHQYDHNKLVLLKVQCKYVHVKNYDNIQLNELALWARKNSIK